MIRLESNSSAGNRVDDGLVRFEDLPLFPDQNYPRPDIFQPAFQLPDILEEWIQPCGDFSKRTYASQDQGPHADGMIHFVPTGEMLDLTVNDSQDSIHKHFPGYNEFLNQIDGLEGKTLKFHGQEIPYIRIGRYFDYDTGAPAEAGAQLMTALGDFNVYSIADMTSGKHPKTGERHKAAVKAAKRWLVSLPSSNDTRNGRTNAQIQALSDDDIWRIVWSLQDDDDDDARLLRTLYGSFECEDPNCPANSHDYINWDHHAGILYRNPARGTEMEIMQALAGHLQQNFDNAADGAGNNQSGGSPAPAPELYTFSADGYKKADGSYTMGAIVPKRFSDVLKDTHRHGFFHLALWSAKDLRPGGYPPADATDSAIDLDQPSRPIQWAG